MYPIVISDEAQLDISESSEYYLEISEDLQERFLSEIIAAIDEVQTNPTLHQIRYRNIRIAFTQVFPFGIHFFIDSNTIFINRILHTKRFFK
ncbi:type II toxin-antitoxin system RelE/ParE family toxin [Flavobacterium sp. MFBS3-15]|uniref:type II toxin-antitoxin system RelE/ParE family toxin n=1 Tax=Flavobacterium sp. MFBS3-15 TaxID=2989816 RepID=UPI0022357B02|nr:type II toxin-antitoxin system RelE/ParE family toxin [Flavobacterium sp. MFBS3-15]MCW4469350.1 type II toxin-antitoxin system RelE/ParE family toxin [Flavobacterium sp. MFBS3-15]